MSRFVMPEATLDGKPLELVEDERGWFPLAPFLAMFIDPPWRGDPDGFSEASGAIARDPEDGPAAFYIAQEVD